MSGKIKFWAYFGTVVGIYGWFIGICAVCLLAEQYDVLGEIFAPGFLVSGIMALFLIFVVESVLNRFGPRSPMLQISLWAMLLSEMGILLFFLEKWFSSLVKSHPEFRQVLNDMNDSMGGSTVYEINDIIPVTMMAAGCVLLGILVGAFIRRQSEDKVM